MEFKEGTYTNQEFKEQFYDYGFSDKDAETIMWELFEKGEISFLPGFSGVLIK